MKNEIEKDIKADNLIGQPGDTSWYVQKRKTRPPKPIDEERLKEMLSINMPLKRIADYFNCTQETLYNRFSDLIVESNIGFEENLRRAQYRAALDLNPTMLIWMGKQVLNQVDASRQHITHDGAVKYDAVESRPEIIEKPDE